MVLGRRRIYISAIQMKATLVGVGNAAGFSALDQLPYFLLTRKQGRFWLPEISFRLATQS